MGFKDCLKVLVEGLRELNLNDRTNENVENSACDHFTGDNGGGGFWGFGVYEPQRQRREN